MGKGIGSYSTMVMSLLATVAYLLLPIRVHHGALQTCQTWKTAGKRAPVARGHSCGIARTKIGPANLDETFKSVQQAKACSKRCSSAPST